MQFWVISLEKELVKQVQFPVEIAYEIFTLGGKKKNMNSIPPTLSPIISHLDYSVLLLHHNDVYKRVGEWVHWQIHFLIITLLAQTR